MSSREVEALMRSWLVPGLRILYTLLASIGSAARDHPQFASCSRLLSQQENSGPSARMQPKPRRPMVSSLPKLLSGDLPICEQRAIPSNCR